MKSGLDSFISLISKEGGMRDQAPIHGPVVKVTHFPGSALLSDNLQYFNGLTPDPCASTLASSVPSAPISLNPLLCFARSNHRDAVSRAGPSILP